MSLISDALKSHLEGVMTTVAETFERDIIVSLEAQKAVISTDLNYSRFKPSNTEIENIPVYYTVPARILYGAKQAKEFTDPMQGGSQDESQLKIEAQFGEVRIKVGPSGHELLKTAKEIELDGNLFSVKTSDRAHGLFSPHYYTYYLERKQ